MGSKEGVGVRIIMPGSTRHAAMATSVGFGKSRSRWEPSQERQKDTTATAISC